MKAFCSSTVSIDTDLIISFTEAPIVIAAKPLAEMPTKIVVKLYQSWTKAHMTQVTTLTMIGMKAKIALDLDGRAQSTSPKLMSAMCTSTVCLPET